MENFKNINNEKPKTKETEIKSNEFDLHDEEYLEYLKDLEINDPASYNSEIDKIVKFMEDRHNRNVPDKKVEIIEEHPQKDNSSKKEVSEAAYEYHGRFIDFIDGTLEKSKLSGKVEKIKKSKEEQAKAKVIAQKKATWIRDEKNRKDYLNDN
jgi:hypothetical protein